MMSPHERKKLSKSINDYYRSSNLPRFYTAKGKPCTAGEFVDEIRPVPLALRFDVSLTDGDKIRLHAWGVAV